MSLAPLHAGEARSGNLVSPPHTTTARVFFVLALSVSRTHVFCCTRTSFPIQAICRRSLVRKGGFFNSGVLFPVFCLSPGFACCRYTGVKACSDRRCAERDRRPGTLVDGLRSKLMLTVDLHKCLGTTSRHIRMYDCSYLLARAFPAISGCAWKVAL